MVLRSLLALLVVGCMQPRPVVRVAERTPAALLLVLDQEHGRDVAAVPASLVERVSAQLVDRNLVPELLPRGGYQSGLALVRATSLRMTGLLDAPAAPVSPPVKTKSRYYSQLNGRYRWTFHARVIASRN